MAPKIQIPVNRQEVMQQNSTTHGSKLKFRADGTITPGRYRAKEIRDKQRRRKPKLFSKRKSGRESHALLAMVKGLFTILFLTLGLYWAATLPFNLWTKIDTELQAPITTDADGSRQNNTEQVAVITPSPTP